MKVKKSILYAPSRKSYYLVLATSDYFLTYDEIAVVCCWPLSDLN